MKKSLILPLLAILAFNPIFSQAPFPSFTASTTTGCSPFTVQYNDQSIGNVVSRTWQFPGGTPSSSTAQSPTVVYGTPGSYSVTLTVSNTSGTNTATQNSYITVKAVPVAGFTNTVSGFNAVFINGSTAAISYLWDFGDGTTSTATNPTHTYTVDGDYAVTLTAINTCGSSTYTQIVTISNGGCGPVSVKSLQVLTGSGEYPMEVTYPNGTKDTIMVSMDVDADCPPVVPSSGAYVYADYGNWTPLGTGATVCVGDTLVLAISQSFLHHEWSPFLPVLLNASIYFSKTTPGFYPIVVKCWNSVGAYSYLNFVVEVVPCPTSGNKSVPQKIKMEVSPNPSSGEFLIELPEAAEVVVSNISGQIVKNLSVSGDFNLDLNDQPGGIYFLTIVSEHGSVTRKLIKS